MESVKPKQAAPTWTDELALLARPAALLLVCLSVAAVALTLSSWLRTTAQAELAEAAVARDASATRLRNVAIEKQELAEYGPRFALLRSGGMIGDEPRLRWIEAIKQSQLERKLISADYDIEPQQAVHAGAPMMLGDYHLRASRMRLALGMVHELDLFNTLADLRAAGPYTVQDCQIKRNEVPAEAVGVARLSASCTLIWLTLGGPPQPMAAPFNKGWP